MTKQNKTDIIIEKAVKFVNSEKGKRIMREVLKKAKQESLEEFQKKTPLISREDILRPFRPVGKKWPNQI